MRILTSEVGLSAIQSQSSSVSTRISGEMWSGEQVPRTTINNINGEHPANVTGAYLAFEMTGRSAESLGLASTFQSRISPINGNLDGSRARGTLKSPTGLDDLVPPQTDTFPQREEYGNAVGEVSDDALLGTANGSQLVVLKRIIEAMTGKRVLIARSDARNQAPVDTTSAATSSQNAPSNTHAVARNTNPSPSGWGISVDIVRTKSETQSSNFVATGTIVTDDGRSLQFDVSYVKQSTRIDVERIALREGDARVKDPLVLLYSGSTSELAEKTAAFDLDEDGTLDQLPGISNGAYVVYDANHDGSVSGATELLGAKSGNGFAELSALDSDKNGFIDSADSAYQAIRLWDPTKSGASALATLASAQIGALYTGQVASPFDIRNSSGNLQGRVRGTGIYVTEAMDVRLLEQVDLVQRAEPRSIDVKA